MNGNVPSDVSSVKFPECLFQGSFLSAEDSVHTVVGWRGQIEFFS